MQTERHNISFVPNYKTVVNAGQSHFSRVADALAEFVDNSIQATQWREDERIIKLGLDLNYYGDEESCLSVLDNGEGMDIDTLSDFAVYSLDKASRGLNPSNEISSNISKFGVGAKQAGFYLGTRIHVLTSAQGSSKVLELIYDSKEIEEKFHKKEDVYKGHISIHDVKPFTLPGVSVPSDFHTEGQYNRRLKSMVNKLFEDKIQVSDNSKAKFESSFTLISIRLRPEIKSKLHRQKSFMDLPTQLAEIYHFHLHPENLPNQVAQRTYEKYGHVSGVLNTKPIENKRSRNSQQTTLNSPLEISFQIVENEQRYNEMALNKLDDIYSRYFRQMKHSFRFNVELPDPNPSGHEASEVQRNLQSQLGVSEGEFKTVQGLILYFPSEAGRETKPTGQIIQHPVLASGSGSARNESRKLNASGKTVSIEDSSDEEDIFCSIQDLTADGDEDDNMPLCRIFWQNRLVPETTLDKLSFFPDLKNVAQIDKLGIPNLWNHRIKCFLFFDANFHCISNNKLKLTVDPDLQTWITAPTVVKESRYTPKNAKDVFPKWLKSCTEKFDQEFRYEGLSSLSTKEFDNVSSVYRRESGSRSEDVNSLHVFEELQFSSWNGKVAIHVGQDVKITLPSERAKKQGVKVRGKKDTVVFGKILGFVKFCYLLPDATHACGQGYVWYRQVPDEVYGSSQDVEHVESIRYLNFDSMDDLMVKHEDIENLRKQVPSMVKVEVLHRPRAVRDGATAIKNEDGSQNGNDRRERFDKENIQDVSKKDNFTLFAGEPVDIIVTVLSSSKKFVLHRPDQPLRKYAVSVRIDDKNFGKSNPSNLFTKKKDKSTNQIYFDKFSSSDKTAVHYYDKIQFKKTGESIMTLSVDVWDGERKVIPTREFAVKVSAGPVSKFSIVTNKKAFSKDYMLGSAIPTFSLSFFDEAGNKSSAFCPPERLDDEVSPDDSLNLDDDECSPHCSYWVRVSSQHDGMEVLDNANEDYDDNSAPYAVHEIPKVDDVGEILTLEEGLFIPLPMLELVRGNGEDSVDDLDHLLENSANLSDSELTQCWSDVGLRKPLISSTQVGRKEVTFDVTTNLCPGVTQSFTMSFTPGYPARISLLGAPSVKDGPQYTVRNGSPLPALTVACYDTFNNRTDPPVDVEWNIVLMDNGPVKCCHDQDNYFAVQKGGKASLKGLFMNVDQMSSQEVVVEQELQLRWPAEEVISPGLNCAYPQCSFIAKVLPGNRPDRIEILQHGRTISSMTISETVGTIVTGLSLRVIDESGEEWTNSEGVDVEVLCSWETSALNKGYKSLTQSQSAQLLQGSTSTVESLADLLLPDLIGASDEIFEWEAAPLEFSVSCTVSGVSGEQVLDGDFNVKLLPEVAVRWKMILNESCVGGGGARDRRSGVVDESAGITVRCDDEDDLTAAIARVCAVDRFGNECTDVASLIVSGDSPHSIIPTIVVKWDDDEISDLDHQQCLTSAAPHSLTWTSREHRHESTSFGLALKAMEGVAAGRFVLQNSDTLRENFPDFLNNTITAKYLRSSRTFWLHCVDSNDVLAPSIPIRGMLYPGIPVAVHLHSPSVSNGGSLSSLNSDVDDNECGSNELMNVPFASESKLTDLRIILVDSCSNVVNLKKLSDRIKDVSVQIEFDPSIVNPDPTQPPADVNGSYGELLLSKKIKNTVKSASIHISIDFEKVFSSLEIHQTLMEGSLVDLICKATYQDVIGRSVGTDRQKVLSARHHALLGSGTVATAESNGVSEMGIDDSRRDKVYLIPARLNCAFKKLDLVSSLAVAAIPESDDIVMEHESISCGSPFYLQLVLVSKHCDFLTEPNLEDIDITVKHTDGGSRAPTSFDFVDDMESFLGSGEVMCPPGQSESMERIIKFRTTRLWKKGKYIFNVEYRENRSHLTDESAGVMIPKGKLKVSTVFELYVRSGVGVCLLPSPATESWLSGERKKVKAAISRWDAMDNAMSTCESEICVTDSPSSNVLDRCFGKDNDVVDICLYDEYGNAAEFPAERDYVCVCQVKHRRGFDNEGHVNYIPTQMDNSVRNIRLPKLDGSDKLGYLRGRFVSGTTYQFSSLALEEFKAVNSKDQKRGADGQFNLVFSLVPANYLSGDETSALGKIEVRPYKVTFRFTSDEERAHACHELQKELKPLEDSLRNCDNSIEEAKRRITEANEKLSNLLGQCNDAALSKEKNHPDDLEQDEILKIEDGLLTFLADIQSRSGTQGCRAAIKDLSQMTKLRPGDSCLGHVVDLAWIEDEKEARVISWAAGAKEASNQSSSSRSRSYDYGDGFIKARVFETAKEAKVARKHADELFSCFSLDRMVATRSTTAVDPEISRCDSHLVPLPDILLNTGQPPSGNPRHIVNTLELRGGQPYHLLRRKLFHAIFRNKILMDTDKSAKRFIDHLVMQDASDIPIIYTLEGGRFSGDGFSSPNDRMPAKLDFVFGAPPSDGQGAVEDIKRDLDTLVDIKDTVSNRAQYKRDLDDFCYQKHSIEREVDRVFAKEEYALARDNTPVSKKRGRQMSILNESGQERYGEIHVPMEGSMLAEEVDTNNEECFRKRPRR